MRDVVAPLSRGPVPIRIGALAFALAWRPAAEWTTIRTELDVIRWLDDDARNTIGRLTLDGTVTSRALTDAVHQVLELVTGRRWWEGHRLLQYSVQPETLGHLALAGVDPWQRSAYEWCAAVYALHTQNADEAGRLRFDFQLSIPPRGYEDEWGVEGGDDPEAVQMAITAWMGG
jgi:hypothetical protein